MYHIYAIGSSVQASSVAQLCPTLCDPTDCRTPGFPVHHQLSELAQTHVHCRRWCHPISSSVIPFSFCLQSFPQHQIRMYLDLSLHPIYQGTLWIRFTSNECSGLISFRIDWFDLLAVQGIWKVFSNIAVQKHPFFGDQPSLWSNSPIHAWLLEKS